VEKPQGFWYDSSCLSNFLGFTSLEPTFDVLRHVRWLNRHYSPRSHHTWYYNPHMASRVWGKRWRMPVRVSWIQNPPIQQLTWDLVTIKAAKGLENTQLQIPAPSVCMTLRSTKSFSLP